MDDRVSGHTEPVPSLKAAIRSARVEEAERSEVSAQLRGAELARLDMLREAIEPVLAQIPEDVDMFDAGLMPGVHPRLFIDMIAFVEMGHDKRLYRFVQDTRYGRVTLAETERLDQMTDAVTAYIARRLVEREKALAADQAGREGAREPVAHDTPAREVERRPAAPPRVRGGWAATTFALLLDYLGILALLVIAWLALRAGYLYWDRLGF